MILGRTEFYGVLDPVIMSMTRHRDSKNGKKYLGFRIYLLLRAQGHCLCRL